MLFFTEMNSINQNNGNFMYKRLIFNVLILMPVYLAIGMKHQFAPIKSPICHRHVITMIYPLL